MCLQTNAIITVHRHDFAVRCAVRPVTRTRSPYILSGNVCPVTVRLQKAGIMCSRPKQTYEKNVQMR